MGCQCSCGRAQEAPYSRVTVSQDFEDDYSDDFEFFGTYDHLYKLVVVGDSNSGKTNLVGRFVGDSFIPEHKPTIGVEFRSRTIELDGAQIKLEIYDTGGVPRYRSITSAFCRGATGIIVTYNATEEESFASVPYWTDHVKETARSDVKLILVGTHGDCTDEKTVYHDAAQDFARKKSIPFLEVSSKDGTNVELAFMTLVATIYQSQL